MIQINNKDIVKKFGVYFIAKCNNKTYFCKKVDRNLKYNEFIAEEIASDYGIKHAHYEMGDLNGVDYIMSEAVYDDNNEILITLEQLEKEYPDDSMECNLIDIWYFFEKHFSKHVTKLMDQLIEIFLFDVLIGNSDRHLGNICLIINKKNGDVNIAPIFDNEIICESLAIYKGYYKMAIDKEEYNTNILYEFLSISDDNYINYLESKLDIICSENLDIIFDRLLEKNIVVPTITKNIIKSGMSTNRRMILSVIKSVKEQHRLKLKYS